MSHLVPRHDADRDAELTTANVVPDTRLSDTTACPLCHTEISAAAARAFWQCRRCGHSWTPRRLATVASYAEWVVNRPSEVASGRR